MTIKSLGNPFDGDIRLTHTTSCQCDLCRAEKSAAAGLDDKQRQQVMEQQAERMESHDPGRSVHPSMTQHEQSPGLESSEDIMDRVVESAIVRGMFGHDDMSRRNFIRLMGGGTLAAALGSILPLDAVKAAVKDSMGPLEKKKLQVGFVPITCATPIIMAQPMGFYAKYGLDVDVIKTADHIIDLGPEGGEEGGYVVGTGTPEDIAKNDGSYTGGFLRQMFSAKNLG